MSCPKGHDPMINETVNHIVTLTTGASSGTLSGSFRLGFYGHYVSIDADASVATHTVVKAALESLGNIGTVDVSRGTVDANKGAVYSITFTSWLERPKENNMYKHDGSPDISLFSCQTPKLGQGHVCTWAEVQVGTLRNTYCSSRGSCDFTSGSARARMLFMGIIVIDLSIYAPAV